MIREILKNKILKNNIFFKKYSFFWKCNTKFFMVSVQT
jgi:hypothetical protein